MSKSRHIAHSNMSGLLPIIFSSRGRTAATAHGIPKGCCARRMFRYILPPQVALRRRVQGGRASLRPRPPRPLRLHAAAEEVVDELNRTGEALVVVAANDNDFVAKAVVDVHVEQAVVKQLALVFVAV